MSDERRIANLKYIIELGKSFDETMKSGNKIYQGSRQSLQRCYKRIQAKIVELDNDAAQTYQFLLAEKRKHENGLMEATIRKDGYDRKYHQEALNELIEPLFKRWKSELEFQEKMPPTKQIVPVADIPKPKIIENVPPFEMIKPDQLPVEEKIESKSVEIVPDLPKGFTQIKSEATQQEILDYFMFLSTEINNVNGEIFMEKEDVLEFLKKNFALFNCTPTGKIFPINLLPNQKTRLTYFIFKFYVQRDRKVANRKKNYAMLLINNFEIFKDDNPLITLSNMSESKRPTKNNIIPSLKFPSGKLGSQS